jgi:hypothetical protein
VVSPAGFIPTNRRFHENFNFFEHSVSSFP